MAYLQVQLHHKGEDAASNDSGQPQPLAQQHGAAPIPPAPQPGAQRAQEETLTGLSASKLLGQQAGTCIQQQAHHTMAPGPPGRTTSTGLCLIPLGPLA